MRIAVYHNLPSGGAKRALYEYVKRFKNAGHTIDLYILDSANESFLNLKKVVDNVFVFKLFSLTNRFLFLKNIFIFRIIDLFLLLLVSRKIAKIIDSKTYDFAFITNCQITQNPCLLRYLKIKKILYSQEPLRIIYDKNILNLFDKKLSSRNKLFNLLMSLYLFLLKSIDSYNILKADLVLVNSYFSRESFIRAYGINPKVVYLGIDVNKFKDLNLQKENYVLSVGSVDKLKGHDFVIKSLSCIDKSSRPNLLIIADRENEFEKKYIVDLAKDLNVDLEILSNVSEIELVNYYNKAKLVAYASIMEPFGFVPLEALSCGTPVVGICESGIRETILDNINGLLTERNTNDFAKAIQIVMNNKRLAQNFVINGQEIIAKNFTWQNSFNKLYKIIISEINAT